MDEEVGGEIDEEEEENAAVQAVVVSGVQGDAAGGELAMKFSFDSKQRHALLSFSVPAASKKLLMLEVLSKVSAGVVIREVSGIRSSFVIEATGEPIKVMTEGVNLNVIPSMSSMIDVNKLRSSDIWAMMQAYGVEAGRACIVEEIGNVFASYGIAVNPRHLTLIADYMTFDGTFRPMNRLGMDWGKFTRISASEIRTPDCKLCRNIPPPQDELRNHNQVSLRGHAVRRPRLPA
jgi:DNA-directed RNA polymerase I subunit RPA1